jgi:hypothetical protein
MGNDPDKISSLIFNENKDKTTGPKSKRKEKFKIKIRVIPDDAQALQILCDEFEKKHGLRMPYKGENLAIVTHRMVMELMWRVLLPLSETMAWGLLGLPLMPD